MNQTQIAQPARRRRARRVPSEAEQASARVTVAWIPAHHDGPARLAPTELELVTRLEPDANRIWTSPEGFGPDWLEAIEAARCSEVVLTARLGNDLIAKHSVLELAELLTFKLSASQPLIRVLFVPSEGAPRGTRTHA